MSVSQLGIPEQCIQLHLGSRPTYRVSLGWSKGAAFEGHGLIQCSQVQVYHREHIRPHSLVPAGVLNLRLQCFVGGLTVPRPPALNAAQMLVALAFFFF